YHRKTGIPLWQSGNQRVASTAKDTWVLGIGPFEQGTIHSATHFAGDEIRLNQLNQLTRSGKMPSEKIWVAQGIQFNSPESIAWRDRQQQVRLAQMPDRPKDASVKGDSPTGRMSGDGAPSGSAPFGTSSLPLTDAAGWPLLPRGSIQGIRPAENLD